MKWIAPFSFFLLPIIEALPWAPSGPPGAPGSQGAWNSSNCSCELSDLSLPLKPHPIYRFLGKDTQIEALFPRSNGQLLVSSAIPPRLYQLSPTNSTPAILVHEFPGGAHGDLLGIAELEHDVFYTATVNFTPSYNLSLGSNTMWRVDMNSFRADADGNVESNATVTELAVIREAGSLNGVTSVYSIQKAAPDFLLVSDSLRGVVWRISTNGSYSVAVNDTTMAIPPKGTGTEELGINGLKVQDGYLYYTNSGTVSMWRIAITDDGYAVPGAKPQFLAKVEGDDFAIDASGQYAYVAGTLTYNVVYRVNLWSGDVQILGGIFNSTASPLNTPTAVQFGRYSEDVHSIYVTTDGGHTHPVAGTQRITRFDVHDCSLPFVF